jgi:hypothetical protein
MLGGVGISFDTLRREAKGSGNPIHAARYICASIYYIL